MSVNHSMHAGSWTKLTLTELKNLCAACGLFIEGNKEELGEKLHAYFDKRKDKGPKAQLKRSNRGQEPGPRNAYNRTGEVVDVDLDKDRGGEFENDLDEDFQEADNRIREEFAACFRGKEKVKSVLVDVFLTALSSIERKMNRNFFALYREIEDEDKAWPKVLPESNKKEIAGMREEVESRAVTLRLADNRGWGTVLQIVGSNNKMIEKYKDRISLFSQSGQSSCLYE
ncbi:15135_t:CDS:2 [Dentiscutata erythropus]|uniref:15135_t:CDS:1 n=1 Tax=Dentiscutata erythropus TaxID=1348616 RepID=A0A9N9NAV4_9GLOM|nr:15135_t:CDS:2 [Dentiscutata erythropus]